MRFSRGGTRGRTLNHTALLLTLLSALSVSCSAKRAEAPPAGAAPTPAPLVETQGAASVAPDAGAPADVVVNDALVAVSRLRELESKGPVRGRLIARAEMLDHVREQIHSEVPESAVRATGEMLFLLGVVPGNFDYEKSLLVLLESQLAGFYEPKDKTMYLLADLGAVERHATLAHELVHALQDQHYDLGQLVRWRDDATDELSAVHALAEGDATSAMLDQLLEAQGKRAIDLSDEMIVFQTRSMMEVSPAIAGVPTIIKRSVLAPYIDGLLLVHQLRRKGGWASVDGLWRKLPTTTEQLLHFDKLSSREPAETISIPAAASGMPSTLIYHDVLGEQSIRLLFEEWLPRKTAVEAAASWAGDRIAVFEDGERFALAWHMRWDREDSARKGFVALARGLLRDDPPDPRPGEMPSEPAPADAKAVSDAAASGRACRERPRRGPLAAVRIGRDVGLVAGPMRRDAKGGPSSVGTCPLALAWATAMSRR